jgi:hypothetical protein
MIWILTEAYNEYNQYGEYFVAAWPHKPSPTELILAGASANDVPHLLNGGGRRNKENYWFNLREEPENESIKLDSFVRIAETFGFEYEILQKRRSPRETTIRIHGHGYSKQFRMSDATMSTLDDLVDDLQLIYFELRK